MDTQIEQLIKKLTETGEWNLDRSTVKALKSILKQSDANVEMAFEFWFAQLKTEHAQVRYSCVQFAEELFGRSHRFRELLTDEFPSFLSLTIGIQNRRLPPPANVAAKLKQYTVALVKTWHTKYSRTYRPVGIGYEYLRHQGLLDQPNAQSLEAIHADDSRRADRHARIQVVSERRIAQIELEIDEHMDLFRENLQTMEGCFEILVPRFDDSSFDFDALAKRAPDVSGQDESTGYKERLVSHGLASNRYKITIDLSEDPLADQVHESEENKVVYEQLREGHKLLFTKHLQLVNGWLRSLSRIDNVKRDELLKRLLDMKVQMTEVLRKCELLGIKEPNTPAASLDDIDEDEFMDELFENIEIPTRRDGPSRSKEELFTPASKLPPAQRIFPLAYEKEMEKDVTYNRAAVFRDHPSSEVSEGSKTLVESRTKGKGKMAANVSSKEELIRRAPVVEWEDDLYYWDKKSVQFNTSGIEREHRFMGTGEGTNIMPEKLLEQLTKRATYYKTEAPREIKACRAPLRKGGLCPRRDLVTCPFHGKIIPRDEFGTPVNPEDEVHTRKSSDRQLWEEIENDVMLQTGQERIDSSSRRGRKRAAPESKLMDIKREKDTSYSRIEKKINAPNVRRSVEEAEEYERSMKSRNRKANIW
ncbi:hypothetical protein BX666DRAFT_1883161 [Dichotomocladium elegans]|nr:hypothetical protein BX666DRAFT_1883161 [Dichotomocladium elegans]